MVKRRFMLRDRKTHLVMNADGTYKDSLATKTSMLFEDMDAAETYLTSKNISRDSVQVLPLNINL